MDKIITNIKLLRKKSVDVDIEEAKKIIKRLRNVLLRMKNNAIGLAAPQIGIFKNVICFTPQYGGFNIINPEILKLNSKKTYYPEGCLSIPKTIKDRINIKRPKTSKIKFINEKEQIKIIKFNGIENRAIQHEIDHLNGILIIDYIDI